MQDWRPILLFVRDHYALMFGILLLAVMGLAFLAFEAFRSLKNQKQLESLQEQVRRLERERSAAAIPVRSAVSDPVVLPERWVRSGFAATSPDGGCLVLVDKVHADQNLAILTVRVDGEVALKSTAIAAGEVVHVEGKKGTYGVELGRVQGIQALLAITLRSPLLRAVARPDPLR